MKLLFYRNLFQLEKLDLSNNHLSSWGPGLFTTPARNLQTLDLSNNQVLFFFFLSMHPD